MYLNTCALVTPLALPSISMSIASPEQCCDVREPPIFLFKARLLYPLDMWIGTLKCSLIGSNTFSANSLKFSKCAGVGSLLIPFLFGPCFL